MIKIFAAKMVRGDVLHIDAVALSSDVKNLCGNIDPESSIFEMDTGKGYGYDPVQEQWVPIVPKT